MDSEMTTSELIQSGYWRQALMQKMTPHSKKQSQQNSNNEQRRSTSAHNTTEKRRSLFLPSTSISNAEKRRSMYLPTSTDEIHQWAGADAYRREHTNWFISGRLSTTTFTTWLRCMQVEWSRWFSVPGVTQIDTQLTWMEEYNIAGSSCLHHRK